VAIQGDTQSLCASDLDIDALGHLKQMARKGVIAFGFRFASGVILLVGDSRRTVIVEACETDN